MLWALQWWVALQTPIFADEAYYLDWSREPSLGYFDHPPAVAWWIWLSPGHPRLTGLMLLPLAWWFLSDAARAWHIAGAAWLPAMVMATPLGFSAGVVTTPDAPLLFSWCLALWALARNRIWLLSLALAACLWSKMAVLVMLPGLFLVLGLRRALWVGGVALLLYSPHVFWSADNGWLPWSFQSSRGGTGFHLLEAVGGQFLVLTPPVFLLVCRAWWAEMTGRRSALFWLSLPAFGFWMACALFLRVEANWTALVWPAALLLILRHGHRWLRRGFLVSGVLTVICGVALPLVARSLPPDVGPPRAPMALRDCLVSLGEPGFLAGRYQDMSLLRAAGEQPIYAKWLEHRACQYDLQSWSPPVCGFVFVGEASQMGVSCQGRARAVSACGRSLVVCSCGLKKEKGPSEDGP